MKPVTPIGVAQISGETITIAGKTYRLAPLTVAQLGELERWVMSRTRDPIEIARELAKDMPQDLRVNC